MTNRKMCVDCKHYREALTSPYITFPAMCSHEENKSLVNGSYVDSPHSLRYGVGCGREGKWWEAK